MSDLTSDEMVDTNTNNKESIPGELSCFFGRMLAWTMLLISGVYGVKFLGPYLHIMTEGQNALQQVNVSYGYIFVSGIISALILFILIAICENLILINKNNK